VLSKIPFSILIQLLQLPISEGKFGRNSVPYQILRLALPIFHFNRLPGLWRVYHFNDREVANLGDRNLDLPRRRAIQVHGCHTLGLCDHLAEERALAHGYYGECLSTLKFTQNILHYKKLLKKQKGVGKIYFRFFERAIPVLCDCFKNMEGGIRQNFLVKILV